MFIPQKRYNSLQTSGTGKKQRELKWQSYYAVVLCPYCHIYTRRTLANGVLQVGHLLGIDTTASAQLEQNRECPHGTSATLSRGSIRHTSHMSLDAATAVTVEVAMAGGVELTTGSWLLASASLSLSSSDVTWNASV